MKTVLTTLLLILIIQSPACAGYAYVSLHETDENGDPVWFSGDTIYGDIHSNEAFNIAGPTVFYGTVSTSADSFNYADSVDLETVIFRDDPVFNAPEINFSCSTDFIRSAAIPWIEGTNADGREMMTRVWFKGSDGIVIYQYPWGTSPPPLYGSLDELRIKATLSPPGWGAVFINGKCEIYGEVNGSITIGSSGDMYLVDDIYYSGSEEGNGHFDWQSMSHMLGLASEKDIIIQDNYYNGREDGFGQYSPGRTFMHSIIINAALYAPDGSLRFQHTNKDWEAYQGPSPDERGIIHLSGMLVQNRRAALHNDNHDGTGYSNDWIYDRRFDSQPPPFMPNFGTNNVLMGDYWGVFLFGHTKITGHTYTRTISNENYYWNSSDSAWIEFLGPYSFNFSESLYLSRPRRYYNILTPVVLNYTGWSEGDTLASFGSEPGFFPENYIRDLHIGEGIEFNLTSDSIFIDSCSFAGPVYLEARYISVSNSRFTNELQIEGWRDVVFEHNVVTAGMIIGYNPRNCLIGNNTITNPGGDGIVLDLYRNVELSNNIIAYSERGIVNDHRREPVLRYNNVYGNETDDYVDCEPGEGSISADPKFNDIENGNYHLAWNSPCIDAGDPELPRDPDGSVREIGAYYYNHDLQVGSEASLPETFNLTAYPNPFNDVVNISFNVPQRTDLTVVVVDINGRLVWQEMIKDAVGREVVTLSSQELSVTGLYLVNISAFSGLEQTIKVVHMR